MILGEFGLVSSHGKECELTLVCQESALLQ